jgi:hypothetical protein
MTSAQSLVAEGGTRSWRGGGGMDGVAITGGLRWGCRTHNVSGKIQQVGQ